MLVAKLCERALQHLVDDQYRLGQLGDTHEPRLRARHGLHLDLQLDLATLDERKLAGDRDELLAIRRDARGIARVEMEVVDGLDRSGDFDGAFEGGHTLSIADLQLAADNLRARNKTEWAFAPVASMPTHEPD